MNHEQPITREQIKAATEVLIEMANVIRQLGKVPSGVLYSTVAGPMSLADYETAIGILKSATLIRENNHELVWIGPAGKEITP